MVSMYCWPSVSIKRGTRLIVGRKVIKAEFEWKFGYLLISIDGSFSSEQVTRVITSKNDQFIDPVHEVPLDSPVKLCQQYGLNVCYFLMPEHETVSTAQRRNAFEVIMQSSNERKCPKRVHSSGTKSVLNYCGTVLIKTCTSAATYLLVGDTELRGDHLVRNKLLDLLEEMKIGWTPDAVDSIGERFVKQLTNTLWYLDFYHQKFSSRSIHL